MANEARILIPVCRAFDKRVPLICQKRPREETPVDEPEDLILYRFMLPRSEVPHRIKRAAGDCNLERVMQMSNFFAQTTFQELGDFLRNQEGALQAFVQKTKRHRSEGQSNLDIGPATKLHRNSRLPENGGSKQGGKQTMMGGKGKQQD